MLVSFSRLKILIYRRVCGEFDDLVGLTSLPSVLQPKIVEENLTYAELDLVKPVPEAAAKRSGTVYAQILFEEQQL